MALNPFTGRSNQLFNAFLRDFYDDLPLAPYWSSHRHGNNFNAGLDVGEIENNQQKFAVKLDVSHFKPEELKINLDGNVLTIEGNHETQTDHGFSKRSFSRQFTLPSDSNLSAIHSQLSNDGHLAIEVPKNNSDEARSIPIHTPSGQAIMPKKQK